MTEQEQVIAHLKQEWNTVISDMQSNANRIDRNLRLIRKYTILRDSFKEAGYDVSEAMQYELSAGFYDNKNK